MGYTDQYLVCLNKAREIARWCCQTGKRPALGYTSNLDMVVEWDEAEFNRLLAEYLKSPPAFTEGEVISTIQDLARIICFFAANGMGGEVEVDNIEVVNEIKKRFNFRYGLGGTCAQGAAALAAIGTPALIHITDASDEVIDFLAFDSIETVRGGKRVPIDKARTGMPPLIHLIMQFTKGGWMKTLNDVIQVPLSNRVIIDYDQVHKSLPVQPDYMEYLEAHAELITSYDISGFNAILDLEVLKERVTVLSEHFRRLRKKNQKLCIYLESAHYISSAARDYVYGALADCIDIIGMNEEELVDLAEKSGIVMEKDDIDTVISCLDYILDAFPVKGFVLHTKDYSMYYGDNPGQVDIELGLTMGNLMSGTRARTGRYGTPEDCLETLKQPLSETGLKFYEELGSRRLKRHAILVPSRYMERPVTTIGLGDTFVAGMQLGFMN